MPRDSVRGGTVSRDLTVVDPAAPGGRRMDPAAVLDAFDAAWSGPDSSDAVLVEMSDLERADRDGLPLTGPDRAAGLASPLQQADAMLGQLLHTSTSSATGSSSSARPRPGASAG